MATILRSDVFRCRQTIVVGSHPPLNVKDLRYIVNHRRKPLSHLILSRIIGGSPHPRPKKGGLPVVQATKQTAKLTILEILCHAPCAVSWNECVFVMVVRLTPNEVVSRIWIIVCNHVVVRSARLLSPLLQSRGSGTQKRQGRGRNWPSPAAATYHP